ncbi:MAG: carbohydrate kinase family protein [Bacteroidota bacterium]
MNRILVSGLVNWETTVAVEGFPIPYFPVRYPFFGINGTVSGVGFNLARALTTLGDEVSFLSLVGQDPIGEWVHQKLEREGIRTDAVLPTLRGTPQSVILFDGEGKRQVHVDLKDIQDAVYPEALFLDRIEEVSLLALCNINFSRPLLKLAKERNKTIATDVHVLGDLDDPNTRDFIQAADILFQSDEKLPVPPEEWIKRLYERFQTPVIVIGLGKQGALLAVEGRVNHFPAVQTRPIVNTIGAGDSLFSSFLHFHAQGLPPEESLRYAQTFASWKIGANGGAEGFLDEAALRALIEAKPVL